jgi:hypothetical protein
MKATDLKKILSLRYADQRSTWTIETWNRSLPAIGMKTLDQNTKVKVKTSTFLVDSYSSWKCWLTLWCLIRVVLMPPWLWNISLAAELFCDHLETLNNFFACPWTYTKTLIFRVAQVWLLLQNKFAFRFIVFYPHLVYSLLNRFIVQLAGWSVSG